VIVLGPATAQWIVVMERRMVVSTVIVELGLPGELQLALRTLVNRHDRSVSSDFTVLLTSLGV
jgi:hypothetical protein